MHLICNDFSSFPVCLQPCGAEEDLTTITLTLKLIGRQFMLDTNRTVLMASTVVNTREI